MNQAYFQNGAHPDGVNLVYAKEQNPLGTAGPLGSIPNLDEIFLVISGAILTSLLHSPGLTSNLRSMNQA